MKNTITCNYDEKAAIENGLRSLIRYNKAMRFSVDEKYIDSDIIERYFKATDESEAKALERILGEAAVKACFDNPDILRKKHNSQLMQREFLDACRSAKIEYEYNAGVYGVGLSAEKERSKRLKEHRIVTTATVIEKTKRTLKNMPARMVKSKLTHAVAGAIATSSIGTAVTGATVTILGVTVGVPTLIFAAVGAGISIATEAAWRFTPPETKKRIKDTIYDTAKKAEATINRAVEKFENTTFGKKVKKVVEEKIEPVINRGVEIANRTFEAVRSTAKSVWTRFKSLF